MAIFKCKICGGTLEITSGETVATCEYCGTKQTLPKLDDEKKANLFDRANHFRRNNDFDKAMGIYEQILNEDTEDAECYWSIVLCRYGIEYVEDPSSRKRVPTVNRAQFTSVFDDEDYKSAIKYADAHQKELYEKEATAINEIQKGILAISGQEEPFDVFICYKETDANGRRTQDSVLATELYHELTREGYKVFFSRITLEDKLGTAYEPYIFAALNSSKVMVVLGTKSEHFNAVWVRNEWSRYLALIRQGQKKMLIPAYRDMDPYDLPEEFSHLQAQDMSKLGFMQDLVRGITKLVSVDSTSAVKETVVVQSSVSGNTSALVKRGFLALEDGDWNKADEFFEQALNQDAEDAQAYLGKLMIELQVKTQEALKDQDETFENNANYQRAIRFADNSLSSVLTGDITFIKDRNEKKAKEEYNESIYTQAIKEYESNDIEKLKYAISLFEKIVDWKDSKELIVVCEEKIEQIQLELERQNELKRIVKEKTRKKIKKISLITLSVVCVCVVAAFLWVQVLSPMFSYNKAQTLLDSGNYDEAITIFTELEQYKDSSEKVLESNYKKADALFQNGDYEQAAVIYQTLGEYEESNNKYWSAIFEYATMLVERKDLANAEKQLDVLSKCEAYSNEVNVLYNRITDCYYNDALYKEALASYKKTSEYDEISDKYKDIAYKYAMSLYDSKDYNGAKLMFKNLPGYLDSDKKVIECDYQLGLYNISKKNYAAAISAFERVKDYNDSKEQLKEAKYLYVNAHKNRTDTTTHKFLKDLKAINYKDSASIFKELYKWTVTLECASTTVDDYDTIASSIRRNVSYFHVGFRLNGGEPGEKATFFHKTRWPNGTVTTADWYWENKTNGGYLGCEWGDGLSNSSGTMIFEIYNKKTWELVGSASFEVKG